MANLSTSSRLGNTSTSSLIKSSRSIQSSITANQDEFYRIQYQNSAKTATDLQTYQQYLTGRIGNLLSTGSVTDNTKAMTLSQTIVTATASNISSDITRENIAILNGNATPQDKLTLITQEFSRAGAIGDTALQQSLVSQASSLSQTINYQAKVSTDAHNALLAAGATQQNDVAGTIKNNLTALNDYVAATGMSNMNTQIKTFINTKDASGMSMKDKLTTIANSIDTTQQGGQQKKDLILNALNTSQPSYADLIAGSGAAMMQAHYLAYVAQLPIDAANGTDLSGAHGNQNGYLQQSQAVGQGDTKLPTLAGGMSLADAITYQQDPAKYSTKETMVNGVLTTSLELNAQNGVRFNANGNVVSNYTGDVAAKALDNGVANDMLGTLKKLGFSYDQSATPQSLASGLLIQGSITGKNPIPDWLKPVLGGQLNPRITAFSTPQGLQITSMDAKGKSNIYLVPTDSKGKNALYTQTGQDANGVPIYNKQAPGDYGFNQNQNSLIVPAAGTVDKQGNLLTKGEQTQNANYAKNGSFGFGNLANNLENWFGFGHANAVSSMVNNAQSVVNQMQVQMQQTQGTPVGQLTMPTLPTVKMPNMVNPTPVAAPVIQNTLSPAPITANPQANNATPQAPNVNPQSAGTPNLNQSGGNGISLGQSSGWSMQL